MKFQKSNCYWVYLVDDPFSKDPAELPPEVTVSSIFDARTLLLAPRAPHNAVVRYYSASAPFRHTNRTSPTSRSAFGIDSAPSTDSFLAGSGSEPGSESAPILKPRSPTGSSTTSRRAQQRRDRRDRRGRLVGPPELRAGGGRPAAPSKRMARAGRRGARGRDAVGRQGEFS
mgnify:CR=1 FL=1